MAKKNYIKIIFCTVLALSCMLSFGEMTAYAASLKTPSITSENTSATSVKLKWKKDSTAKKFTIYRSTSKNKNFKAIKTVKKSTLTYTDKKLTCGKTYYYKVKAINGKKSKTSKVKSVKVVPKKVGTISAVSTKCGEVVVSYGTSSGADGYQLCASNVSNGNFTAVNTSNVTSVTQNVQMGTTAYYKVRAYKTVSGKKVYSAYSKVVSATALSHSFSAPQTVVNPNCKQTGVQKFTCTICGYSYDQAVPTTAHNYVAIQTVAPTCGAEGYTVYKCSICSDEYKTFTPATGQHTFGEAVITYAPTCTADGTQKQVCTVCGYSVSTSAPALGHSFTNYVSDNNATCTEDGTKTAKCDRLGCDATDTVVDEGTALGHDYNIIDEKEPTCTETGYKAETCSRCKDTITTHYDALGHNYNYCVIDEKVVQKCNRCGNTIEGIDISNLTDFELDGIAKY